MAIRCRIRRSRIFQVQERRRFMPQMTQEIIRAAIAGFEEQKRHIDDEIAELRAILPGSNSRTDGTTPRARKGRHGMSAEGRARIAEAQRKRWAALKGDSKAA